MVCSNAPMISLLNISEFDTFLDIKAASLDIYQFSEQLEEDDEIDENLKIFLLNALNEGKFQQEINRKDDEDDVSDEGNVDGENDPQYELFLKHLKEHGKSYAIEYEEDNMPMVVKYEEDIGPPEECDPESRKKVRGRVVQKTGFLKLRKDRQYDSVKTVHRVRNKFKRGQQFNSNMASSRSRIELCNLKLKRTTDERVPDYSYFHQNIEPEDEQFVDFHNCNTSLNDNLYRANDQRKGMVRKLSTMMCDDIEHLWQKPNPKKQRKQDPPPTAAGKNTNDPSTSKRKWRDGIEKVDPEKNLSCHVVVHPEYLHLNGSFKPGDDRGISMCTDGTVANTKTPDQRKLKRTMNQEVGVPHQRFDAENQQKHYRQLIQKTRVKDIETFGPKDPTRGKSSASMKQKVEFSHEMLCLEKQHKHELQHNSVKSTKNSRLPKSGSSDIVKCSSDEFMKFKQKNSGLNNPNLGETEEEKPSIKLLDRAIVCSKNHEDIEDNLAIHRHEFRNRVLDVLRKPFDKEEYLRHQEAIKAGTYLQYHPEVGRKLAKYRYKPGKRLTILRGFFFWLQCVSQEGAFRPWKDRECLAVEPGS